MTGDLPVTFEYIISNTEGHTAFDVVNSSGGNTIKDDLLGALNLLIHEVIVETFGSSGAGRGLLVASVHMEGTSITGTGISSKKRRRLSVMYMDDVPPTLDDISDVGKLLFEGLSVIGSRATLQHVCF